MKYIFDYLNSLIGINSIQCASPLENRIVKVNSKGKHYGSTGRIGPFPLNSSGKSNMESDADCNPLHAVTCSPDGEMNATAEVLLLLSAIGPVRGLQQPNSLNITWLTMNCFCLQLYGYNTSRYARNTW